MIRIEKRRRATPEIGIAPLVDCMLLLLIFFLLTSSFSEKVGIKISLPGSDSALAAEHKTFDVAVADTGEITFKGAILEARELTAALTTAVAEEGPKPVFQLADRNVSIEKAAEIIDCVRAAGIESVAIAARAKPLERGGDAGP